MDEMHNGELADFPKTYHTEEKGEEIECTCCGDIFYASGGYWVNALGQGYYIPDKELCDTCDEL